MNELMKIKKTPMDFPSVTSLPGLSQSTHGDVMGFTHNAAAAAAAALKACVRH